MSGKIDLAQLHTVQVTRDRITYAAPIFGKANRDHALSSLRDGYTRIAAAMMKRLQMRESDFAGMSISGCGNYVTIQQWVWRD